jgi:glycosyltransferase involved in cell wall biosynthesis
MATGLPVIVSERATAVVSDGVDGLVVPVRDADALADRLVRLYENRQAAQALGAAARATILQGYTWEHYRRRLVAAYRAIAAGQPAQAAVDAAVRAGG